MGEYLGQKLGHNGVIWITNWVIVLAHVVGTFLPLIFLNDLCYSKFLALIFSDAVDSGDLHF